jgi:DNA-binding SARP family transcriptional activator
VDFRILGPLEVWHDGRAVAVTGARQRALLALLLLHAGEVVSTDRLLDEIWGDAPPAAGPTALRVRVSQLRKALRAGGEPLVTRPSGYMLRLEAEQLDLRRFERLVRDGQRAADRADHDAAVDLLDRALALWRGPALADLAYEPFAHAPIVRREELRLAAIELHVGAELALGRHARVVGELRSLVAEHPLRERLWGHLMLALYRDGRQAEALDAYRTARRRLVDDVGIEPGPELRALERRILAQDEELGTDTRRLAQVRSLVVLPLPERPMEPVLGIGEALAGRAGHELIVVALLPDAKGLAATTSRLHELRAAAAPRGVQMRVAAFTSSDLAHDAARLATDPDVAALVVDAPQELVRSGVLGEPLVALLRTVACDVAVLVGAERREPSCKGPVVVPFAGHEHDWAAIELGGWLAEALGSPLRLVGANAAPDGGRPDASRLLGNASLALQRGLGVASESALAGPGADGLLAAASDASHLVVGLSERWAREGLGAARVAIAARSRSPVLFVRRGLRPGGLAPPEALTRYTWSNVPR